MSKPNTTPTAAPARFPGSKWLDEATYLTETDRVLVRAAVAAARSAHPGERISVRAPSYTGEPHPIAVVMHGGMIYRPVYR